MAEKDVELRIAKLEIKHGDILVVKVKSRITDKIADDLKRKCEDKLPSGVKVMVLDDGIDLAVLSFNECKLPNIAAVNIRLRKLAELRPAFEWSINQSLRETV